MLSLKFFKKIILLRCLEMWCSGFTLAGNTKDGVFEHNGICIYIFLIFKIKRQISRKIYINSAHVIPT